MLQVSGHSIVPMLSSIPWVIWLVMDRQSLVGAAFAALCYWASACVRPALWHNDMHTAILDDESTLNRLMRSHIRLEQSCIEMETRLTSIKSDICKLKRQDPDSHVHSKCPNPARPHGSSMRPAQLCSSMDSTLDRIACCPEGPVAQQLSRTPRQYRRRTRELTPCCNRVFKSSSRSQLSVKHIDVENLLNGNCLDAVLKCMDHLLLCRNQGALPKVLQHVPV